MLVLVSLRVLTWSIDRVAIYGKVWHKVNGSKDDKHKRHEDDGQDQLLGAHRGPSQVESGSQHGDSRPVKRCGGERQCVCVRVCVCESVECVNACLDLSFIWF